MDVIAARLEARQSDHPLIVDDQELSGGRLMAELYRLVDSGLVFLDIGWADPLNPRHPEHRLPEIDVPGPPVWDAGEFLIRYPVPSVEPELVDRWRQRCQVRERLNSGREAGRIYADEAVGPTLAD